MLVAVLEVADVVVVVAVDVRVEVVVEDWLMNDPVWFGTYYQPDFDHQS